MKGIPPPEYPPESPRSPPESAGIPIGGSTGNTRGIPGTRACPPPRSPHSPTRPHSGSPPLPRPSRGRVNPRGFHGGTPGEYGRYRGSRGVKPAFNEGFPGNSLNFATFSSRDTPGNPREHPRKTPCSRTLPMASRSLPGPPGNLPGYPRDTPGHPPGRSWDTPGISREVPVVPRGARWWVHDAAGHQGSGRMNSTGISPESPRNLPGTSTESPGSVPGYTRKAPAHSGGGHSELPGGYPGA